MDYSFMLLAAATTGLLVAMLITLARTIAGPSLYDRVLAVNSVGTKIVLLIAAMGFLAGRPDFLDIALLYALVNFIGTLAVLKFFRYRHLGIAGSADDRTAASETGGRR